MLKFTRNRTSSSERVPNAGRIPRFERTDTKEFSPQRAATLSRDNSVDRTRSPLTNGNGSTTPRSSRSCSVERLRTVRRQLNFESGQQTHQQTFVKPVIIPTNSSLISGVKTACVQKSQQVNVTSIITPGEGNIELIDCLPPALPSRDSHLLVRDVPVPGPKNLRIVNNAPSPGISSDFEQHQQEEPLYKELSSGTFCRSATFAPMTKTVERLSNVSSDIKPKLPPKSALKKQRYDFHKAVEKLVEKLDLQLDTSSESGYGSDDLEHPNSNRNSRASSASGEDAMLMPPPAVPPPIPSRQRPRTRRIHFDSYVLLLQGIREHNLELVQQNVTEVCTEALGTDEILNAFMQAVATNEVLIVQELLQKGCNANCTDLTGLTPLHLAATFNSLAMIKILLRHGAAIFARAHSSGKTPAEMCSPHMPDFQACHAYLRCMEECLGIANEGVIYVARQYRTCRADELWIQPGDKLNLVRKGDYHGSAWWSCRNENGEEGYVLKDLLALHRP